MAGYSYAAWLHRVLVLPVAGARAREQDPTVLFHRLDEIPYLHVSILKFLVILLDSLNRVALSMNVLP